MEEYVTGSSIYNIYGTKEKTKFLNYYTDSCQEIVAPIYNKAKQQATIRIT
eukprot:gene8987-6309_t